MTGRTSFFNKLGAEFANVRWSWCAVKHDTREVFFGIWDTMATEASGTILSEDWELLRGRRQPGYSDALKKLRLVEDNGYTLQTFGMSQGQGDYSSAPSIIKEIDETIRTAKLVKVGPDWIAVFDDSMDEISEALPTRFVNLFPEGARRTVIVNAYERNAAARRACIEHFGPICQACKLNFEERYGPLGRGFIHVHHKNPVSATQDQYKVSATEDLIPLCPNCHAMVHRTEPPMLAADLAELIERYSNP